jgi:hypothetical protein
MANSGGDNKHLGIAAALAVAIGGLIYSTVKLIAHLFRRDKEGRKVAELVHKGLADGLTEEQIVQAFYDDAEKQFGRALTSREKSKIIALVHKEKNESTKVAGAK